MSMSNVPLRLCQVGVVLLVAHDFTDLAKRSLDRSLKMKPLTRALAFVGSLLPFTATRSTGLVARPSCRCCSETVRQFWLHSVQVPYLEFSPPPNPNAGLLDT